MGSLIDAVVQLARIRLLGGDQLPGQGLDLRRPLARRALGPLPRQRVGEDISKEPEPWDQLVGPAALCTGRPDLLAGRRLLEAAD
jgi:hypothetical protein